MGRKSTAIVFVGQGTQYPGMCQELTTDTARSIYEHAYSTLGKTRSFMAFNRLSQYATRTQVKYSNLAIFVNNHAFYASLINGLPELKYSAVAGHSLGLFNAVISSGAITYEDCLPLMNQVSDKTQKVARTVKEGLAILRYKGEINFEELKKLEDKRIYVALVNDPRKVVLGGPKKELKKVVDRLNGDGVSAEYLRFANVPFHTPHMDDVREHLKKSLDGVALKLAGVPIVCNSSGDFVVDPRHTLDVVLNSINNPVKWVGALSRMEELGIERYIVLGADKEEIIGKTAKKIVDKNKEVLVINNQETLDNVINMLSGE